MSDAPPPGRRRRRWLDDDLLSGLNRTDRPEGLRAFFASTIAASLLVWDLAFTLGAYHTVFYSRLFQILVVSSVLLLGSILVRRDVRVRGWMRGVLSIPLVWLAMRLISPFGASTGAERIVDDVLIGFTVATVPLTMWAVARVVAPDYFALPDRRLKIAVVGIVVVVAAAGFVVGRFNYRFTTCEEYVVSGDNTPANCSPPAPPVPSSTP